MFTKLWPNAPLKNALTDHFPNVNWFVQPNSRSGVPLPNTAKSTSSFNAWSWPTFIVPSPFTSAKTLFPPDTPSCIGPHIVPISSPTLTRIVAVEFCPGAPRLALISASFTYSSRVVLYEDRTIPVL